MYVGIAPPDAGIEPGAPVGGIDHDVAFTGGNPPCDRPVDCFVVMNVDIGIDDGDVLVAHMRR